MLMMVMTKAEPMAKMIIHLRQYAVSQTTRNSKRPTDIFPVAKPIITNGCDIQLHFPASIRSSGDR